MALLIHTYRERPDLADIGVAASDVWPEYNLHGDILNHYWRFLAGELGDFQLVMVDGEASEIVGELHTGPLFWDGGEATLPDGIDDAIRQIVEGNRVGHEVNTLCALAAEVLPSARGTGLARESLMAMSALARSHGFAHLIAPVRPSWKERYPLTPIEEYVQWRRSDGSHFDPWIRTHERVGGNVSRPLPRSMSITGTVVEWETWTDMSFPATGDYVFPSGLSTLAINREQDTGVYWEPNVWVVHTVK